MRTILRFSSSSSFQKALLEWLFTGEVIDYGSPNKICGLCSKDGLRYHFKIKNKITGKELLVGSECITKFEGIEITDDNGQKIHDHDERSKRLEEIKGHLREESMLEQIRSLYRNSDTERRCEIKLLVDYYKIKGGFAPFGLERLFSLMDDANIKYTPTIYRISLRTVENQRQLRKLRRDSFKTIFQAMSDKQQIKFRHLLDAA